MEIITRKEIETLPTIQMDDNTEEYCIRKDRLVRIIDYIESLESKVMHTEIVYVEADSKEEAEQIAVETEEREIIYDEHDYDTSSVELGDEENE